MPRPRPTTARFLPLCLLAALATAPTYAQQGDCGPITPVARRSTGEPPLQKTVRPAPVVRGSSPSVSRASPSDPPVPSVAIRVRVPAEVTPGQELKYTVVAENVSRADAHHVTVRVPTPSNAKYVRANPTAETEPSIVWKLGTLRGGEKQELDLVVTPTGDGEIGCCARIQFEHGQCVKTRLIRPGVQVKKSGPIEAAKYDPLKFKIEVSNTGRTVAKNVVVEETLPAGLDYSNSNPSTSGDNPLTWKLGDLEPGKTRVLEYDAIPSAVGPLTTKAVVTAEGGVKREAAHLVRIGEAALSVSTYGPRHRHVGRPATYRIVVRNTGTLPATHVELSDFLPREIEHVNSPGGQLKRGVEYTNSANEKQTGDEVKWSLGTIAPGASRMVWVMVRAKQAGSYTNVGSATADRGVSAKEQLDTRFDAATGLSLEVEKGEEPLAVGQTAEWTVRVLNKGSTDQTNVGVLVRVPEGLKATEVRGTPNAKVSDDRIQLPQLAKLAAGEEKAVVIRFSAEKAGEHRLRVEAVSDAIDPNAAVKVEETVEVSGGTKRTSERPGRKGPARSSFVR